MKRRLCPFVTSFFFSVCVHGASITVPNFSFEDPDVADGGSTLFESIPGWNRSAGLFVGVRDPLNTQYPGTTGTNAMLPGSALGAQSAVLSSPEGGASLSTTV